MRMRTAFVACLLAAAVTGCTNQRTVDDNAGPHVAITAPAVLSVGQSVDFSIHTHCGVEGAHINGQAWKAVEPLYSSSEKLGPPDGWGNPFQNGTLTLESPQRAVFVAPGKKVVLVPSTGSETPFPCA